MKNLSYLFYFLLFNVSCTKDDIPKVVKKDPSWDFDVTSAERPIDLRPEDFELDVSLSDLFDADEIASKWDYDPNDWGPWSWEAENAFTSDGKLQLQMQYKEHSARGMDMFYTSGIVRSKDTITYGYVEARMKGIPLYPTASPAFWLYSIGSNLDQWGARGTNEGDVRYCEIDVVELTQGNWDPITRDRFPPEVMDHNLHAAIRQDGRDVRLWPREYPEQMKTEFHANFDPRDDFHTYGADISPEKVIFYVDGLKISEKDNLYWHLPMHVTLSLGLRYPHVTYHNCPDNLARCPVPSEATENGFPTKMEVDWVRIYRRKN